MKALNDLQSPFVDLSRINLDVRVEMDLFGSLVTPIIM